MNKCFFCEKGERIASSYHEIKFSNNIINITNINNKVTQVYDPTTTMFIEYCPFCGRKLIKEK